MGQKSFTDRVVGLRCETCPNLCVLRRGGPADPGGRKAWGYGNPYRSANPRTVPQKAHLKLKLYAFKHRAHYICTSFFFRRHVDVYTKAYIARLAWLFRCASSFLLHGPSNSRYDFVTQHSFLSPQSTFLLPPTDNSSRRRDHPLMAFISFLSAFSLGC